MRGAKSGHLLRLKLSLSLNEVLSPLGVHLGVCTLHPVSRDPLVGRPGGYGAGSQVRTGDGALHVFSTQMVLVAVGAGEVAGDGAHSRNDVSQSTSLGEHSQGAG